VVVREFAAREDRVDEREADFGAISCSCNRINSPPSDVRAEGMREATGMASFRSFALMR
jgi:hypothetical protein